MYRPLIVLWLELVVISLVCGALFAEGGGVIAFLEATWQAFWMCCLWVAVCFLFAALNGRYGGPTPAGDDDSMNYNTNGMPMLGATDVEGNAFGSDSSSHRD